MDQSGVMTGHGLTGTHGRMTSNWSWTDSSWTASGTPSTQESEVPTVGTGPRPTVQNQTAQISGAASSAQHTVSSIPLDRPSTVQITDLESGVVTGGTGRQIRTGTPGPGLLGAFIGTVTVLSLFGNSQGTPISPVTLEDTDKTTVPSFDSLSKIHDDCVFFDSSSRRLDTV